MRGYLGLLLSVMLIFEACIARMPSPQAPRATASLPPMSIFYTPTSIPTLGGETTWQEPLAQRSVILERPSPSGGRAASGAGWSVMSVSRRPSGLSCIWPVSSSPGEF